MIDKAPSFEIPDQKQQQAMQNPADIKANFGQSFSADTATEPKSAVTQEQPKKGPKIQWIEGTRIDSNSAKRENEAEQTGEARAVTPRELNTELAIVVRRENGPQMPNLATAQPGPEMNNQIINYLHQGGDLDQLAKQYHDSPQILEGIDHLAAQRRKDFADVITAPEDINPDELMDKIDQYILTGGRLEDFDTGLAKEMPHVQQAIGEIRGVQSLMLVDEQDNPEGIKSPISPNQISDVQRDKDGNIITTLERNGEKIKLTGKQKGAIIALMAADLALFRGRHTVMVAESMVRGIAQQKMNGFLESMGINTSLSTERGYYFDKLMQILDRKDFNKMLEQFTHDGNQGAEEVHNFVEAMSKQDRQKMLRGEEYGGFFGSKHKIGDEKLLAEVLQILKPYATELEIEEFYQTRNTQNQTPQQVVS